MNAIQNYINALFSSLPQTPTVLRMQAEMLENLEEKYQALLREGKNQDEAIGIILASIGTVDELKAGLGIQEETHDIPKDKHNAFLAEHAAFQKRFAIAIAGGVALCICAVIAGVAMDELFHNDVLTVSMILGPIAIAVAIFVFFGIREDWYEQRYKEMSNDSPASDTKSPSLISLISDLIFPLAAIFYVFIGFQYNLWHPGWVIFPICAIVVGGLEAIEAYQKTKQ